jgi:hypothetical protein
MESSQILSERKERLGDEDKSPEERRKRPLDVSGASTRSNSAEPSASVARAMQMVVMIV